jgi:hypothetical protein
MKIGKFIEPIKKIGKDGGYPGLLKHKFGNYGLVKRWLAPPG